MAPRDEFRRWFQNLGGAWTLERTISDGSSFAGKATFAPLDEASFLLTEEGKFRPANHEGAGLPSGRQWVWRLAPGDALEICYPAPDGRLYHRFAPVLRGDAWHGEAVHPCGEDSYAASYRLGSGAMEVVHDVVGPAKRYRLASRYSRA